jgi:hypothetical protein
MARGDREKVAALSSDDLLRNGDIELRSLITRLGAIDNTPAKVLAYEAFYRGIIGMGVAYWDVEAN